MRHFLLTVVSLTALLIANAQIAISTDGSTPHASAMLEVKSTNRGLLLPRLTYQQRIDVATPTAGLIVFQTNTSTTPRGFYIYDGTAWKEIAKAEDITAAGNSWTVSGSNQYSGVSGNVGVGTVAPDEKMDINGNLKLTGSARLLRFETAQAGPNGQFTVLRYAPGIQFVRSNGDALGKIEYVDTLDFSNFLRFYTGSAISNALTINTDNFVGIGTQNPQVKMQVVGAGEIIRLHSVTDPLMQFTTGLVANGIKKGFLDINGNDFRIGTNSENNTGNFIVRVNGTNRVYVDPAGNVGIGNLPETKFHIGSGSDAGLASNGYLMLGSPSGSNIVFDNNEIIARNNGAASSLVLQNDGGSVRIGNVAVPTGYKFAINGKMLCEELKVKLASSGWPDYVFADTYKLRSLRQLETYISINKHLPNIPSAGEIEKNGLEVGDMQKRMMEKIEELTLYIIDLQKQIDELKKAGNTKNQN